MFVLEICHIYRLPVWPRIQTIIFTEWVGFSICSHSLRSSRGGISRHTRKLGRDDKKHAGDQVKYVHPERKMITRPTRGKSRRTNLKHIARNFVHDECNISDDITASSRWLSWIWDRQRPVTSLWLHSFETPKTSVLAFQFAIHYQLSLSSNADLSILFPLHN